LVEITEIRRMLGSDFVECSTADQARSIRFVNQKTWVSIVPHPQIDAVSQINSANRRPLAVVGAVEDVLARLERGPTAKRAKRAPAR
jgi:hypothetical protein